MEVITADNGIPSFNQILSQLMYVTKSSEDLGLPVGILTSDNRDNWAEAYKLLSRGTN